jgi:dihydrofolate synthase/folylpolyglutamate synthase
VPAVSGATVEEARQVIESICRRRGAPLASLGVDFRYRYQPGIVTARSRTRPRVRISSRLGRGTCGRSAGWRDWPEMELSLLGDHQAANAAVAVACVELLRRQGWHISEEAVARGLASTDWPARLELMGSRPLVVLDCAHNIASARALVETLHASFPEHLSPTRCAQRRLLIFAASNDKDIAGILRELAPAFTHAFFCRYGNNPRSVPPEQLAEILSRCSDLPCTLCDSAAESLQSALELAGPDDLVCVTGSVFLAGELRPLLLGNQAIEMEGATPAHPESRGG